MWWGLEDLRGILEWLGNDLGESNALYELRLVKTKVM